jgi:hypothetical protein
LTKQEIYERRLFELAAELFAQQSNKITKAEEWDRNQSVAAHISIEAAVIFMEKFEKFPK